MKRLYNELSTYFVKQVMALYRSCSATFILALGHNDSLFIRLKGLKMHSLKWFMMHSGPTGASMGRTKARTFEPSTLIGLSAFSHWPAGSFKDNFSTNIRKKVMCGEQIWHKKILWIQAKIGCLIFFHDHLFYLHTSNAMFSSIIYCQRDLINITVSEVSDI